MPLAERAAHSDCPNFAMGAVLAMKFAMAALPSPPGLEMPRDCAPSGAFCACGSARTHTSLGDFWAAGGRDGVGSCAAFASFMSGVWCAAVPDRPSVLMVWAWNGPFREEPAKPRLQVGAWHRASPNSPAAGRPPCALPGSACIVGFAWPDEAP